MTEAQWQQTVIALLKLRGYACHHHYDSRRSEPGWPDLVAARPGRVLFLELKSQTGRVRAAQARWLELLASAGLEVALLRPGDLPRLLAAVGPAQERLRYGEGSCEM